MKRWQTWLVTVALVNATVFVRGDVVPYGNFEGADVRFISVTESSSAIGNGPDQVPHLFGPPTVVGNSLMFFPTLFEANQLGVGIDLVDGQLSFQLLAKPGFKIAGIAVEEFGDYTLATPFSGGEALIAASAQGFAMTPDGLFNDGFQFLDSSQTTPGKFGLPWFGGFSLAFPEAGHAHFTMNNTLTAAALQPTDGAFIKKKGVLVTVQAVPIPEPGPVAVWVLIAVGLALSQRSPR